MKNARYVIWFVSALILGAVIVIYQAKNTPLSYVQDKSTTGTADIGGPFILTDQNGNKQNTESFKGKFLLIYFGYSFCPDICPMGLHNMTQALELLKRDREQIVPMFVTIDPLRDTVSHLKVYATNFHPNFLMLTGTQEEITPVLKLFHVYSAKSNETANSKDYLLDHSTLIYLMDRNGKFLTYFPHSEKPEVIAAGIQKYLITKS